MNPKKAGNKGKREQQTDRINRIKITNGRFKGNDINNHNSSVMVNFMCQHG